MHLLHLPPSHAVRRARFLAIAPLLAGVGCVSGGGAPPPPPPPGDDYVLCEPGSATPVIPQGIRYVGRTDHSDPAAVLLGWQGAGVVATVTGTTIGVRLSVPGATVFFQSVVDGKRAARVRVDGGSACTAVLASGLADGAHVVELYRDTEGDQPVASFLGFTAGTASAAPASNGRLIEVVGDSISAGYGNLGSEPHPGWVASPACHWSAENSAWFDTYVAIAGRELNAEVSTIARSGWGMYQSNEGNKENVLKNVYDRALGITSPTVWGFPVAPDAVVVNLGTNDAFLDMMKERDFDAAAYVAAGRDLVAKIRAHAPDAWVFLVIGPMLNDPQLGEVKAAQATLAAALTADGDAKVETFDFGITDKGANGEIPTGCDWHPNVAEHTRMAGILQTHLRARLGW